jgi:hypothetical protein
MLEDAHIYGCAGSLFLTTVYVGGWPTFLLSFYVYLLQFYKYMFSMLIRYSYDDSVLPPTTQWILNYNQSRISIIRE